MWRNMRRIVDEIVDSIKPPERPRSPIDSYLTEREIFQRQNPHVSVINRAWCKHIPQCNFLEFPGRSKAEVLCAALEFHT